MSHSAMHADSFYKEVAKNLKVWSIRDENGIPAPVGDGGKRAMPFWSSQSRAEKVIITAKAYSRFEIFELDWVVFRDRWLSGLAKDGLNVGVNWSGEKAVGYDVNPITVQAAVENHITTNT